MEKILVINRSNNMGDALCHMRGIKEYKDAHPEAVLDFLTCHFLHYEVARHTDLFHNVTFYQTMEAIAEVVGTYGQHGYARLIEFQCDIGKAFRAGILRSWVETTLGFTPSTDRPYFLTSFEEEKRAAFNLHRAMSAGFTRSAIIQLDAPSNSLRSVALEHWNAVLDLFPTDCAVFYPCDIRRQIDVPFTRRRNLIPMGGSPLGDTAALMRLVNCNLVVHGGFAHLAYAVDAPRIIQLHFNQEGGQNLLHIPSGVNLYYPTNRDIDFAQLKGEIDTMLTV